MRHIKILDFATSTKSYTLLLVTSRHTLGVRPKTLPYNHSTNRGQLDFARNLEPPAQLSVTGGVTWENKLTAFRVKHDQSEEQDHGSKDEK